MVTYYKGSLVLKKNIKFRKLKFSSGYYNKKSDINIKILNTNYELTNEENDILIKDFKKNEYGISIEFKNILYSILLSTKLCKKKEINIIYKKIIDKNGNVYGEEILTGFVFPILSENDIETETQYYFKNNIIDCVALRANIIYKLANRSEDSLYKCYCIKNDIADYNEIEEYNNKNKYLGIPKSKFKEKIRRLYNMNVFDENILNQNSNTNNNLESTSTTPSFNSLLNPALSSPISLPENQCNDICSKTNNTNNSINSNNGNISSLLPTDIQLKLLEELKRIINSLTEEDINQLNDITNNDLNNINLIKYILMAREERLELLNTENESKDENETEENKEERKPKVSLKKVKRNEDLND